MQESKIKIEPVPDSIAFRTKKRNAHNVPQSERIVDANIHVGALCSDEIEHGIKQSSSCI